MVDFLFHRGVGGTRSGEDEWCEFVFGREQSFPAEAPRRREFGFALLLLSVSASLREMAFVIASWILYFTAAWGDAIGVG